MPRLDTPAYASALRIARRLHALGQAAFFAGGCVRDLLLDTTPKDFDVATSATPDIVQAAFPHTESVGAHFGVVLVILDDFGQRIATEVATFRNDGVYTDGRRPDSVRFSRDPREDVLRRDFTINGMLLDPLAFEAGDRLDAGPASCVIDYVGGRGDLERKLIRAIGDPATRFAEDKLRMLRAVRFAARLGFNLEPHTLAAIRAQAATITQVSPERIRDELTRILTEGHARRGFDLLDETHLLAEVLPEVDRMQGVQQPPQYHPEGDVWTHTLMLLDHLKKNEQSYGEIAASPTLAWGMLLHDVGKPATFTPPDPAKPNDRIRFNGHVEVGVAIARAILSRLRFSNDDCDQILALIKHHMQFGDIEKMKRSTLKRFLRLPRFDEHLALHYADVMSAHGILGAWNYAQQHLADLGEDQLKPPLLITGRELIAAGYQPGPQFKLMLTAAEDAQLEGQIITPDEGLTMIRNHFGPPH
jgi:poly(A) polymerase